MKRALRPGPAKRNVILDSQGVGRIPFVGKVDDRRVVINAPSELTVKNPDECACALTADKTLGRRRIAGFHVRARLALSGERMYLAAH